MALHIYSILAPWIGSNMAPHIYSILAPWISSNMAPHINSIIAPWTSSKQIRFEGLYWNSRGHIRTHLWGQNSIDLKSYVKIDFDSPTNFNL